MIDIEKFICSLLADHPEGVTVRGDIHRALKEQGLEYKDGKIVPIKDKTELKESRDERIRKSIIGFLITISSLKDGKTVSNKDFDTKAILEWISWLEKQGNETPCDRCKKSQPSHSCQDITELGRCYLEHEKQGEQKPVEWSEADERSLQIVIDILDRENHSGNISTTDLIACVRKLKSLKSIKDRVWSNQGEQTSLQTNERAWLYLVSDVLTWKDGIGQYLDDPRVQELAKKLRSEYAQKLYNSVQDAPNEQKPIEVKGKSALEAVKEEKVDNDIKAEPNLKVGDYVVREDGKPFRNGNKFAQIKSIKFDGNMCFLDTGRWLYSSEIRAWSIYDAQAGDVLVASDGSIFIFAGVVDCACKYYITLTATNDVKINKEEKGGYWETSRAVYPATKEQRDLLFQKMKESGLGFDFEKKELKKIMEK